MSASGPSGPLVIIYSRILIKLVSPIYSEMNRDLFYAGVVSDFQL